MTHGEYRALISLIRNKCAILAGCGQLIAEEARNAPDSRAKGRTIVRITEEMVAEVERMLGAERTARLGPDAHLGHVGSE